MVCMKGAELSRTARPCHLWGAHPPVPEFAITESLDIRAPGVVGAELVAFVAIDRALEQGAQEGGSTSFHLSQAARLLVSEGSPALTELAKWTR
jgi:hypothetical protein